MLFPRRTHKLSREDGFTMIELLVVVIIVAILAAIAVPVYLNLRDAAARSALKSDVNATVKKVGLALTGTPDREGVALSEIVANNGAAYVVSGSTKGESISVVAVNGGTTASTIVYTGDADLSNDGFVIRPAIYNGKAGAVLHATTTAAAANEGDYFVYGLLAKSKGAVVNYDYSYTSEQEKYSEGSGTGGSGTTASTPSLADGTLPKATVGESYSGQVNGSGTPAPSYSATGLPSGLAMNPTTGAITGVSNDAAQTYTVNVTARNGAGSASKSYPLVLASKDQAPSFTSGTTAPAGLRSTTYAGFTVTTDGFPAPTLRIKSGTLPVGLSFDAATGKITGTPSATATGSTVVIEATNRVNTVTQNLTVPVNFAPTVTSTTLSGYTQNVDFTANLSATGSPAPTFSANPTSSIPAGLTLRSDGTLAGKVATAGTYTLKIQATNSVGTSPVQNVTLTISPAPIYTCGWDPGTSCKNGLGNPSSTTVGHTALGSRIISGSGYIYSPMYSYGVDYFTRYRISIWVYNPNNVSVSIIGSQGATPSYFTVGATDGDWKRYDMTYDGGPYDNSQFNYATGGQVWFDDYSITKIS